MTDSRMSGASGRVLTAIHVTPEAAAGGALARVQDGDMVTVDCETGMLSLQLDEPTLAVRRKHRCRKRERNGDANCSPYSATMLATPTSVRQFSSSDRHGFERNASQTRLRADH